MNPGRQRQGGVDRARLLGVREAYGRELGVRLGLAGDHDGGAESGTHEGGNHDVTADAMQCGVDDAQLTCAVRGDNRGGRIEIGLDHLLAKRGPTGPSPRHVSNQVDARDVLGDLGIEGRHDLAAVAEIDLVAIVPGGVVARRHHDAGVRAEPADREGQHRCRQGARQHHSPASGGDDHGRGVTSEDVRVVSGVKSDDHQRFL